MLGTIITGVIVALIVFLAVRSLVKDKKSGKSVQCGSDCSKCNGCH